MAQTLSCARNIYVPILATVFVLSSLKETVAQSSATFVDCNRVTVHGSVTNGFVSGEIDWLALTNQEVVATDETSTSEGCLVDTTGVGVDKIVTSAKTGAAVVDFVEGDVKIHRNGAGRGSDEESGSARVDAVSDHEHKSLIETLNEQPTLVLLLIILLPLTLIGGLGAVAFAHIQSMLRPGAKRVTCRIHATLRVEGITMPGRIMRLGPSTCQFVPNSNADANAIAGMLMNTDLPDFDLCVGDMSFPIIPDTPGSRFTVLFFVVTLTKAEVSAMSLLSETRVRRETKRVPLKKSRHRDQLRASRLQRLQAA